MSTADINPEDPERRTRINYRAWFWRVLAWDGLLPLIVWVAPLAIKVVVPNRDEPVMLAVVLTAIGVFLLRWMVGVKHIAGNRCPPATQQIQTICFFAGLVVMLMIDALALALHDMLKADEVLGMIVVLSIPFGIYLTLMTIAMYPGREPSPPPGERLGNWEIS